MKKTKKIKKVDADGFVLVSPNFTKEHAKLVRLLVKIKKANDLMAKLLADKQFDVKRRKKRKAA